MIAATVALLTALAGLHEPATSPLPRVTLTTDRGEIVLMLQVHDAPGTSCNFLRYVEAGAYGGGRFFRTVVAATNANPNPISIIQAATPAGADDPGFGSIPLERTRDTGLRHVASAISMARDGPDTARSSFFIVVEDAPALDFGGGRNPDGQGFAVFGSVVEGMEIVRAIHASTATDEQLQTPVIIHSARLEGDIPAGCRA